MEAGFPQGHSRCLHTAGPWAPSPPACVIRWHRPKTLLSTCHPLSSVFRPGQAGHLAASSTLRARPSRPLRHARPVPPTPPAPAPLGPSVTLSASAALPPRGAVRRRSRRPWGASAACAWRLVRRGAAGGRRGHHRWGCPTYCTRGRTTATEQTGESGG